jgi:glutamyl-tRNA synthetase
MSTPEHTPIFSPKGAPVRVRIAPSPTGEPHIGTAYTALVNEAFAAKHNGTFIVRIEDTDQVRSTKGAEDAIFRSLKWLGFNWAEGPDVGGPYGPYRQTERRDIYKQYVDELLEKGHAFTCFCTPERLDTMRAVQKKMGKSPKYDGQCLSLSKEEITKRIAAGEPHVVRMKIPTEGACTFHDGVFGEVTIPYADVDMQVIMKADGLPTYHLAVVVDDHLMRITHVIRGEEWLSSVPKHVLLHQYFGWDAPEFIHLPVLRNADRTKLSKRKNHTSISWFERQGYLPSAVRNFLMSFFVQAAEGEEEMRTNAEFYAKFNPADINRAGAVFDLQKLDWFNGRWLRERTSDEDYLQYITEWATQREMMKNTLLLAKTRISKFADLPTWIGPIFSGSLHPTLADFAHLKTTPEQTAQILSEVFTMLDNPGSMTAASLWESIKGLEEKLGIKARLITAPLFIAIGGKAQGLPLTESMEILGRALCRDRLRAALNLFVQPKAEAEKEAEDA